MVNKPKILFLGDMMLGENVYHLGRGIRTKFGDDYTSFIPSDIKSELLKEVDAVVYNFEYSLAPDEFDFKDFESSIYASTVASLGVFPDTVIKIVNIANNHFWERGAERTKFTIDKLKENGFIVVGETGRTVVVEIAGYNFHFWGCSLIDWNVPVFTATYNDLLDKMELPASKGKDDIWIMSVHWGTEFMTYPDKEQVVLAHHLIDRGFDIVHGHHPHVFQPIERYKDGLVMYSMGNFAFDENFSAETQRSYCIKVGVFEHFPLECYRVVNRGYRPKFIDRVPETRITFINGKFRSPRKKSIIFKYYTLLRKIEYIRHISDNNFYVYKSMKKRRNMLCK